MRNPSEKVLKKLPALGKLLDLNINVLDDLSCDLNPRERQELLQIFGANLWNETHKWEAPDEMFDAELGRMIKVNNKQKKIN